MVAVGSIVGVAVGVAVGCVATLHAENTMIIIGRRI
jgi:hypothetical protein